MELLRSLAAALAVGVLIGIERGWRQREAADGSRVSGLRTFGLLGLAGGLASHMPESLAAVIGLAVTASLVLGYRSEQARTASLSITNTLVGIITFVALGQVISGVAQTVAVASMAGQLAYFVLLFVTDMIMPLSIMPAWIQRVAVYLPSYAIVQLVRPPLMLTELDPALGRNLLLAAVYVVAASVVAARLFRWSPRS